MATGESRLAAADNPAQRLLAILQRAEAYRNDTQISAGEAWSTILGIRESSTQRVDLLRLGAEVMQLAVETRTKIQLLGSASNSPVNSELILEHFDKVEATVGYFLQLGAVPMFDFMSPLTETAMYGLKMAADALHRYAPEPLLPVDTVEDILAQTRDLLKAVRIAEDLDPDTKAWLIEELEKVRDSLTHVGVRGYRGVEVLAAELAGSTHRFSRIMTSPLMQGVLALVTALNTAVGTGLSVRTAVTSDDNRPPALIVVTEQPEHGLSPSGPPASLEPRHSPSAIPSHGRPN